MTDNSQTTKGEQLQDDCKRFIQRRRLNDARREEREREVAAFVSGWNAYEEALQNG